MLFQVEVAWGRRILLALTDWEEETGRKRTALFEVVAKITGDRSPNTIAKLLKRLEPPERRPDQIRAVVLLIALGERPVDYGLSSEVLSRDMTHARIASDLRSLMSAWVTGVSTEELAAVA